ncbi:ABC transporter permease [Bacillus toyonensis]|uniref:ABC transporter permease n=1 Tax=Bacillus TaxID=1386 RepID=UPI0008E62117|nr:MULTISPECIES: ABC transporter permease [Bacillus]PGC45144.1 ABC transporter permease [Bacillus toyonensis]SFM33768.1 putative ABC transport system permease protein [Bacillus sp. 5mfcol3.1]
MTLFEVSIRNVTRNFKQYLLYFASLVMSIIIFYTFLSLRYEPHIVTLVQESSSVEYILIGGTLLLIIFVSVFLIYSSNFFTHTRKKEIGLYLLLGLQKGQVGRMMFLESSLMGTIALLIGIACGVLLSGVFQKILFLFMGIEGTYTFLFPPEALMITLITFFILLGITSFNSYRIVYRFGLIELFKATEKQEKEPKSSPFLAIIGIVFLILSYVLVIVPKTPTVPWYKLPTPILVIVVVTCMGTGTYLFIRFLLPTCLHRLKKNKSFYYKGANLISISHIHFRLSTQINIMTMIALLIAGTIAIVGFTNIIYSGNKKKQNISSINYQVEGSTEETDWLVNQLFLAKVGMNAIVSQKRIEEIQGQVPASFLLLHDDSSKESSQTVTLISVTGYNDWMEALNKKDETIKEIPLNHIIPIMERVNTAKRQQLVNKRGDLQVGNETFPVTIERVQEHTSLPNLIVVNDITFDQMKKKTKLSFKSLYQIKGDTTELADEFMKLKNKFSHAHFRANLATSIDLSGIFLFMGLFMGLAFIVATGSMIYFKQVTEAYNDQNQFTLMRKIGMEDSTIIKSIASQIFVIFSVPLLLGISHAVVVLASYYNRVTLGIPWPVIYTVLSYIIIYVAYYLLTVRVYSKVAVPQGE